ncbi:NAD-dependent epimerase/dehydratase family protein [Sinomicrobium pectinilyticum]|uniref:NAD-dependent epimerase/dehydratase family protein n=1 Tax=Sinomicrobium pectinilyticum TaxID=1084421 RepID=A0A3N0D1M1_SINP1|nr:NAD(P)H-binding protein [Sinomicrobium pectinilyticum]RNL69143.1 NAD-dependent epimerase/dehydratase family protein [Sinomicrobium pectinilyticum]
MKVALIGATGFVGTNILKELVDRGHKVTAIARNPERSEIKGYHVTPVKADVLDTDRLAEILAGHDAVVSAFNPGWANPNIYDDFLRGAKAIQEAVKKSGVSRFVVIGGGGSLYLKPGLQVVDTPEFPAEIKSGADAARLYLEEIRKEKVLDWVFFSPALEMHQGITTGRTGKYRLGLENPVFDKDGRSVLSGEDVGVVIADELETPKHHRERFTAAY